MTRKKSLLSNIIGLGILILMALAAKAVSMSLEHSMPNAQFRSIEQPLALKVFVTLGGLGLISLELWWFLFSQQKPQKIDLNGDHKPSPKRLKSPNI